MNNRIILRVTAVIILAAAAWFLLPYIRKQALVTDFQSCQNAGGVITDGEPVICVYNNKTYAEVQNPQPEVVLDQPKYGDLVSSPMIVKGKAKGNWFFEGTMPATLKDENGKVLVQQALHADGDWMTTNYVPFSGTMAFDPGTSQYGVLIINKDNPSGMPELDSSVAVPVRFK
jgi:hypothetical protein